MNLKKFSKIILKNKKKLKKNIKNNFFYIKFIKIHFIFKLN